MTAWNFSIFCPFENSTIGELASVVVQLLMTV
jgi:hypothetical protein